MNKSCFKPAGIAGIAGIGITEKGWKKVAGIAGIAGKKWQFRQFRQKKGHLYIYPSCYFVRVKRKEKSAGIAGIGLNSLIIR